MAIQQGTVTITGFVGSMPVPFGRVYVQWF